MRKIEISEETYISLEKLVWGFGITPETVIKMLISEHNKKSDLVENNHFVFNRYEEIKPFEEGIDDNSYYYKNTPFEIGSKLRYKSKLNVIAIVQKDGFKVNGTIVKSPTAAARVVTGNEVNGWQAWEYFDENADIWREIDYLRQLHK